MRELLIIDSIIISLILKTFCLISNADIMYFFVFNIIDVVLLTSELHHLKKEYTKTLQRLLST